MTAPISFFKCVRALLFSVIVVVMFIVYRGMTKGVYGFFVDPENSGPWKANLIWPPVAGWPLYFAGNHNLPRPVILPCFLWALAFPFLVAAGVAKMVYAIGDRDCPTSSRWAYIALIALFIASLFVYVPIPKSMWDWGYWWTSY